MLSDAGVTRQTIYRWIGSQCTFWCSVLSDPEDGDFLDDSYQTKSQCTFWCSVLSDSAHPCGGVIFACLNAPSGAQCFPTRILRRRGLCGLSVSMHLLVLSAFRPVVEDRVPSSLLSQCTFWCSVLSDRGRLARQHVPYPVSMHLLVLSAFRLSARHSKTLLSSRLNAPSGAQCFPTLCLRRCGSFSLPVSMHLLVLSAFRLLQRQDGSVAYIQVSMHLLVLSAFRRGEACYQRSADHVSMHLLVLSAFRLRPQKTAPQRRLPERNRRRPGKHHIESARTCPIKPHNREKPPQNDPAPPTAPTHQYATDFQRTQAKKPTPHDYVTVNTTTKATVDCPCGDTADRFPPTALLGPTAVSR